MKKILINLTATATSILFVGLTADLAQSRNFYAPAPTPPSLSVITGENPNTWYVTTATDGTDFYGANPFYSQQTSDGNLFVSGVVLMQSTEGSVHGSYIQIDCGRAMYRDLIPFLILTSDGFEHTQEPQTYNWRYFKSGSVFETVGYQYCQQAIADLGI